MTREQEVERLARALAKRDGVAFELFRAKYVREAREILATVFGEA